LNESEFSNGAGLETCDTADFEVCATSTAFDALDSSGLIPFSAAEFRFP
jgi:hypothetical protein